MLPKLFMQKDLRNPKNLADYQEVYKYNKNFTLKNEGWGDISIGWVHAYHAWSPRFKQGMWFPIYNPNTQNIDIVRSKVQGSPTLPLVFIAHSIVWATMIKFTYKAFPIPRHKPGCISNVPGKSDLPSWFMCTCAPFKL